MMIHIHYPVKIERVIFHSFWVQLEYFGLFRTFLLKEFELFIAVRTVGLLIQLILYLHIAWRRPRLNMGVFYEFSPLPSEKKKTVSFSLLFFSFVFMMISVLLGRGILYKWVNLEIFWASCSNSAPKFMK